MATTKYRRKASSRKRGMKRKRATYKAKRTSTRRTQRVPRKKLQTLFGLERKIADQSSGIVTLTTSASTVAIPFQDGTTYSGVNQFLGAAKQSATWDGRIAQKMTLASLSVRLRVSVPPSTGLVSGGTTADTMDSVAVYWAFVLDKTPQAAYPAFSQVFLDNQYNTGAALATLHYMPLRRNPAYTKRYSVLSTGQHRFPPRELSVVGTSWYSPQAALEKTVSVPVRGKVLEFTQTDTDGAVATQTSNGIVLFVWTDLVGDDASVECVAVARTRFYG